MQKMRSVSSLWRCTVKQKTFLENILGRKESRDNKMEPVSSKQALRTRPVVQQAFVCLTPDCL